MSEQKDPNIFQIAFSILAAFFGVQSKKNLERDDAYIEKNGIKVYVIIGFTFAILAVCSLILLVKIILANVT